MPSRLRSAMLAADAPALPASSLFADGGLLSGRRSNPEEPHR
ncbi:rCG30544, partial [Rattus norvegicus]